MNKDDYMFFTIDEIMTPKDNHEVLRSRWWALSKDKKVMIYKKNYHPQCNSDKRIAKMISKKMYSGEIVFIPFAYIPIKNQNSGS